jgi:purine-binding chemotaxis protein CheW
MVGQFTISSIHDAGLVIAVAGPRVLRLGTEATFRLRILNAGDRVAIAPLLFCRVSSTTPGAKVELVESRLKPLAPGQSKVVNLKTEIRKPGMIQCQATVITTGWPEVTARLEVRADFSAALAGRLGDEGPIMARQEPEGRRHLLFRLAGADYAVPLNQVIAVERRPQFTPLPNLPGWLLGVVNLRGDMISLVDLSGFLGLPSVADRETARLLVVKSRDGDMTAGLMVERLVGMRSLECRPTEPRPHDPLARFVVGTGHADDKLSVLDLDRLLHSPALRQLEAS